MTLLIVDEEKCTKDGICAAACPTAIIRMDSDGSLPRLAPGGDASCLRCGHCVAVCPHGALSHTEVPLSDSPPIKKNLAVSAEQAVQFLRSRRSIRFFKDKPPEKDVLNRLIHIARYAPTASNAQLIEWTVYTDREKIHEFAGLVVNWMKGVLEKDPQAASDPYLPVVTGAWDLGYDAVLRHAPALIIASAPKEATNGMVDLTLALSYLELAAPSHGLGTCWAGMLQGALRSCKPIKDVLGIPENHPYHYPMMIGYPKVKYYRMPERKKPKIVWK